MNVRIKKEKNSFAESFSLSELCRFEAVFLVILILTRYEHSHQIRTVILIQNCGSVFLPEDPLTM